jgi:hypothetical protein
MSKAKASAPEELRAAYRRHDEVESNPASRRMFAAHPPNLDTLQRRIVHDLETNGVSLTTVAQLYSPATWETLRADAEAFTRKMEAARTTSAIPKRPKPGKPVKERRTDKFAMDRRYKKRPLEPTSPWLRAAVSERMLDVVNSYVGLWSKLSYVDQWYTPPVGSDADRLGSMRWHRDYNDQHLVKVFVYLSDVDYETGPFEYVPGSARAGPYSHEWPWNPGASETYPPPGEFDRRIPSDAVATFVAPAGTMILCNTSGLHRGGYATEKARSMFVLNYVSPAGLEALVDRNFDATAFAVDLPEVARYAVT